MRSTFMGYETAKSALNYAQKAIDIVGNNIANGSTTTGYTRQRVECVSNYTTTTTGRIASNTTSLAGQGVTTLGVSQTRDAYLDAAFREQYSTASYYAESQGLLESIQTALGTGEDVTDTSDILGSIEDLYESLYDYTSDPTSQTQANVVYTSMQSLVETINSVSRALASAREDAISSTQTVTDRVNTILQGIASINEEMADSAAYAQTSDNTYFYDNELMDERNLLLDELAGYCDISVTEYDDGTCDVEVAGYTAVSGEKSSSMYLQENTNGTVSLKWLESGESVGVESGALLSDLQYINGRGSNAQNSEETAQKGFLYYQDRINTLASAIVDVVNNIIPETDSNGDIVTDANGNTVYKTLLGATQSDGTVSASATVTAENLAISDEWSTEGASYFIFSEDEADYSYALQMSTKLTSDDYTFTSFGEKFTGTMEEYVNDYVTVLADDISVQEGLSKTASEVADDYLDARDEVSAVSQDEETTNLLTYQKVYSAAARVMTVMDELLDLLINGMAV